MKKTDAISIRAGACVLAVGALALLFGGCSKKAEEASVVETAQSREVSQLIRDARAFYGDMPSFSGITLSILQGAKLVPATLTVEGTAEAPVFRNSWGGLVHVFDGTMGTPANPEPLNTDGAMRVIYTGVPAKECVNFAAAVAVHADAVLIGAEATSTFPANAAVAAKALGKQLDSLAAKKSCGEQRTATVVAIIQK